MFTVEENYVNEIQSEGGGGGGGWNSHSGWWGMFTAEENYVNEIQSGGGGALEQPLRLVGDVYCR